MCHTIKQPPSTSYYTCLWVARTTHRHQRQRKARRKKQIHSSCSKMAPIPSTCTGKALGKLEPKRTRPNPTFKSSSSQIIAFQQLLIPTRTGKHKGKALRRNRLVGKVNDSHHSRRRRSVRQIQSRCFQGLMRSSRGNLALESVQVRQI